MPDNPMECCACGLTHEGPFVGDTVTIVYAHNGPIGMTDGELVDGVRCYREPIYPYETVLVTLCVPCAGASDTVRHSLEEAVYQLQIDNGAEVDWTIDPTDEGRQAIRVLS